MLNARILTMAVVGLLAVPALALAAGTTVDPSMTEALDLSKDMYCGTRDVLTSNLGLMIGFVLAATGLYSLIVSGMSVGALATIIAGALLTSLPGIIENFFSGVVKILGPITTIKTFEVPKCSGGGGPK